ncbi:MAG TPA: RNA ligase family protein [Bacilli bacterium]|nr:RNA ligase family protein [Bacilli bacterium]
MSWKKYPSIENSSRMKFVDKIKEFGYHTQEWCVTEKIDGQNFSFIVSEDGIKLAKRSSIVEYGELKNFPGMKEYFDSHVENFKSMFNRLTVEDPSISTVVVYGENYGGKYIHPDVPCNNQTKKVQGRVQYIPHNSFIAYDLAVVTDNIFRYVNYDFAVEVFRQSGIDYIPVLYRGTLDECLEYPNKFNTTIPLLFKLPEIDENICEGVVIKPIEPIFFSSGERVILKNKNEVFSERKKTGDNSKNQLKNTEEVTLVLEHLKEFITENRLKNIISHLGTVGEKDFGILMKDFTNDILTDYCKEFEDEFNVLSKDDQKTVTKWLAKEAANLIRPVFLNIVDGEF